jgi:hypothetical protein
MPKKNYITFQTKKKIWSGHPTDPHYPIYCHPILLSIVIQKKTINYPKNNCWISRKRDEDEKKRESFFSIVSHYTLCHPLIQMSHCFATGKKNEKMEIK